MKQDILAKVELWKNEKNLDEKLMTELMSLNDEELSDAFYTDLAFGTGGLRGILGVGTNRMNIYTVARATRGFMEYLLETQENAEARGVVISYDCRNNSQLFAQIASMVIAQMGVKVYVFSSLRPTPELSFAVRYLNCIGGIMITASHNPSEYNGYKVYDYNGCQLTPSLANQVIAKIAKINNLFDIPTIDYNEGINRGLIKVIDKEVDEPFVEAVKTVTIQKLLPQVKKNLKVVFTPLHGTASISLPSLLQESGYDVVSVQEQMIPDPYFSTVKSPNPENVSAFEYAEKLGKEIKADLLIATDPDADRMGIGVLVANNEYVYLTGNQTGAIILDYLGKFKHLKKQGIVLNTVVSSNSCKAICDIYKLKLRQTLTGFKFIGEQMALLEKSDQEEFFFGYEESYGYVIKDIVRDKDSLQSSLLLVEIASYYKSLGKTLVDVLDDLYQVIGYYEEGVQNIYMEGESGAKKIESIVRHFQIANYKELAGKRIDIIEDYDKQVRYNHQDNTEERITLPKSLVIKYIFDDGGWFVLRPSGTEPKLKVYISVKGQTKEQAQMLVEQVKNEIMNIINSL